MRAIVYRGEQPQLPPGVDNPVWLCAGTNFLTGEDDFEAQFGVLTSLERDLLTLASGIFAADVAIRRGEREEIVRDVELTVPVVNFHALHSRRAELDEILHILSRRGEACPRPPGSDSAFDQLLEVVPRRHRPLRRVRALLRPPHRARKARTDNGCQLGARYLLRRCWSSAAD